MRNLKKHLSVLLVVAMIFTMMAPVFAVSSSYRASYEDEAERLYELGLFKGVSDEEFDPALGSNLSREQAAIILLRLCGQEQEAEKMSPSEVNSALAAFTDANEISGWARKQVAYATSRGIIKGFPGGEFRPSENVTGKQYASLLLQEIGVTDFEYVGALEKLASLDVISVAQMISLDKDLLRDDVVCMSYNILDVETDNGNTVIENLIDKGLVDRELAEEYDLVESYEEEEPAEEPEEPAEPTEGLATVEYKPATSRTLSAGQQLFQIGTVTVTAGDEDVNVTGLKLRKTGMSEDSCIENVTVWSGSEKLNTVGKFNNGAVNIAFTKLVTVEAGHSAKLSIKVNLKDANFQGTPEFSIAVTEVKADTRLEGNFPMQGNTFSISKVSLGTMDISKSGDAPTGTLNAGDENVRLAKFDVKFEKEAQILKQVKLTQNGNISDNDIVNLVLSDDKGVLATADKLTNGAVTFNFEKEYASGTTARLTLRGDIIGGAGRTVQFDVDDQNDVQSEGKVYGATIIASAEVIGAALDISRGTLIVSKDSSSPVASTIASTCDEQKCTSIKIKAVGEPVQIDTVILKLKAANINGVDKVRVLNGDVVIASQDKIEANSTRLAAGIYELELSLSEIVTVDPGQPVVLDILANMKDAEGNYEFGISKVKGTGLVSAKTVENDIDVFGSVMKVGDVRLSVEEVAGIKGYIFPNQANKELTSIDLYHNLGQDVKVSSITVKITDIDGHEIDPSVVKGTFSNISVITEDGTIVSDPMNNPESATLKITLKDGIVVKAGQTVRLSLIADVKSTAAAISGAKQFKFDINTATAVTVESGTDVRIKPIDSNKIVEVSASAASNNVSAKYSVTGDLEDQNVVANKEENQTNLVKLAQWTLTNNANESISINKVYFTATYGGQEKVPATTGEPTIKKDLNEAHVNKYELRDGKGNVLKTFSTLPASGEEREVELTNKLEIPAAKNGKVGEVELVVWANIENGAQYGGTISIALGNNGDPVKYFEGTGSVSGVTVDYTGEEVIQAGENNQELVNTVAISKVTASNISITSQVSPGSGITVGKFRLSNTGNEAVLMKNIRVYFSKDSSGDFKPSDDPQDQNNYGPAVTLLKLYDGKAKEIGVGLKDDVDDDYIDLVIDDGGKRIAAGESEVFEIRLGAGQKLDDTETIQLRLDDKGTTYDSTSIEDNGYRISIDNEITMTEVQAKI